MFFYNIRISNLVCACVGNTEIGSVITMSKEELRKSLDRNRIVALGYKILDMRIAVSLSLSHEFRGYKVSSSADHDLISDTSYMPYFKERKEGFAYSIELVSRINELKCL